MPGKISNALGNLELKRKQNAQKAKNKSSKNLKVKTNIKHPKANTKNTQKKSTEGGGRTRKHRK